jgi:alginate O-acetyltransferase complex protein AlgI
MLFNSFPYVFYFLPIVVALTFLVRKIGGLTAGPRAAQAVVLLASLFFYTWWKPIHLPYLLGSILVNWLIARCIDRIDRATA